jgi:hypothetical protein
MAEFYFLRNLTFLFSPAFLSSLVIASATLLVGCDPPIPQLGKVTGNVTLAGKPLDGIEIVFSPDPSAGPAGRSSRAVTDESGAYCLTYRTVDGNGRGEGAALGPHIVTMNDWKCLNSRDNPIPYRISLRLNKPSSSPLRETVIEGEQTIDFDLTKHAK